MARASDQLRERMLDLAWSLWTGLGVPGRIDIHGDCAIDPEPLILFTAGLGDADSRLRDEATDWCIRYGQLVAGARLKNLIGDESDRVRAGYGEFAATVSSCSSHRWPGATTRREHTVRERPRVQAFNRPSQIVLRLRALLGVGGRADIIRAFLASPESAFSAADLATETSYTKRNMAQVLEALRLADVVQAFPIRNQIHYRMPRERIDQLREQLSPVPASFVRWPPVLHVLTAVYETMQLFESKNKNIRGVEARAAVERLADAIRVARFPEPRRNVRGSEFWDEFVSWSLALAGNLAAGNEPAGDRFKARWTASPELPGCEVMEPGDFAVWRSPLPGVSSQWAFGLHGKTRAFRCFDEGVRYPTVDEAKRVAEVRQFTLETRRSLD